MKFRQMLVVVVLLFLLVACGGSPASTGAPSEALPAQPQAGAPASLEEAGRSDAVGQTNAQASEAARLVIKNANVSLQVERVADAEASLRAKVAELGGYVVNIQTNGSDALMSTNITFRVPAQRFDEALAGLEGLATKVLSRSVSGDDVTEEFVDLESRLRNLEATSDRLLDLLERADDIEAALQVNTALSGVQGEIEIVRGRMQYLQQSSALSTISASLQPIPTTPTIIESDQWQPLNVASLALRSLIAFGQALANIAIVILIWAPVWLPVLLLIRWGLRRSNSQVASAPVSRATTPPSSPSDPES